MPSFGRSCFPFDAVLHCMTVNHEVIKPRICNLFRCNVIIISPYSVAFGVILSLLFFVFCLFFCLYG